MIYEWFAYFLIWFGIEPPSGPERFIQKRSKKKNDVGFSWLHTIGAGTQISMKAAIITEWVIHSPFLVGIVVIGALIGFAAALMIGSVTGFILGGLIGVTFGGVERDVDMMAQPEAIFFALLGIFIMWIILGILLTLLGGLIGSLVSLVMAGLLSIRGIIVGGLVGGIISITTVAGAILIDKRFFEEPRLKQFNTTIKIVGGISGVVSGVIGVISPIFVTPIVLELLKNIGITVN